MTLTEQEECSNLNYEWTCKDKKLIVIYLTSIDMCYVHGCIRNKGTALKFRLLYTYKDYRLTWHKNVID